MTDDERLAQIDDDIATGRPQDPWAQVKDLRRLRLLGDALREAHQHKAKVSELAVKLGEANARLEARQTELLEANNREVERRRQAEDALFATQNALAEAQAERDAALAEPYRSQSAWATENEWLRRLLRWARARLKSESYKTSLDTNLAIGPQPWPKGEPPVVQSGIQAETSPPNGLAGTAPQHEVQHHAGNPKLCRVTGLRLKAMPECEGGGWATDEHTASVIADALNAMKANRASSN